MGINLIRMVIGSFFEGFRSIIENFFDFLYLKKENEKFDIVLSVVENMGY